MCSHDYHNGIERGLSGCVQRKPKPLLEPLPDPLLMCGLAPRRSPVVGRAEAASEEEIMEVATLYGGAAFILGS